MIQQDAQTYYTTDEAAAFIRLSRRTLEKMRVVGGGPKYRKHGRYVRYHIDDLNAWSEGRAHESTHDDKASDRSQRQLRLAFDARP